MSLLVALSNGENKDPDQVAWIEAGWLQATWVDVGDYERIRRFYPPHRIQYVRKTERDESDQ